MKKILQPYMVFWVFLVPVLTFWLGTQHPKIITKVETVTKTIQLPAPKTYICNEAKTDCFEIATDSADTYCFDNDQCAYIYTDKELK